MHLRTSYWCVGCVGLVICPVTSVYSEGLGSLIPTKTCVCDPVLEQVGCVGYDGLPCEADVLG